GWGRATARCSPCATWSSWRWARSPPSLVSPRAPSRSATCGPCSASTTCSAAAPRRSGHERVEQPRPGPRRARRGTAPQAAGRHVALKVLPPEARLGPHQRERFQREAKAAARLHHTNIVPVYGVGEYEGTHYYAMQFIEGQGLDAVLRALQPARAGTASPETN